MALSCGIIGLPMVGKTTFFNLLTNAQVETSQFFSGKTNTNFHLVKIPDKRLDYLEEMYKPRKKTHATLEVTDVPGLVRGSSQGQGAGNEFLNAIREVDALIHVVRAFKNDQVLHVDGSVDILRDLETINLELLFADLQIIETRIERITTGKKRTKEHELELSAMHKCKEALESDKHIHQVELTEEERKELRHIRFLTEKPMIIVINVDEDQLKDNDFPFKEEVLKYAAERDIPCLEICAKVEVELRELSPEDAALFMDDLGITEPGVNRLAQIVYQRLGLISFLTAGEDEVRAWTIRKGLSAKQAAGKIHSDIERGFIRAEVVAFDDLKEHGSMTKVKEKGLARLEGKDYIVQDGDIINFRFNV